MKTAEDYLKPHHLSYKDPSDRDSYSSYREGYSDAMDIAGQVIKQAQKEAYNAGKEQLKREAIIIISEDGFVLKDETLDSYREKLKIIIDVL